MIRISPATARVPLEAGGLTVSDDEWQLDPDEVGAFVEATTGLSLTTDPDGAECYRIGTRLEGFIEARKRDGEWTPDLVAAYPDVDSLEEILSLARFFRECHACSPDDC